MITHENVALVLDNWNHFMISAGIVLWFIISMIVIMELHAIKTQSEAQ